MAAMKPHGLSASAKRRTLASRPALFGLTYKQAQAAHIAITEYLRDGHSVTIRGERVVTGKYAPNSQLDASVRLAIRLNRYLLGGKHYNNSVVYGGQQLVNAAYPGD